MIRVEDLKENILDLKPGNRYIVYKITRKNKKIFLRGIFVGETGFNNELYTFESDYGFKECFHKVDFLINEYRIEKISKKKQSLINIEQDLIGIAALSS